MALGTVASAAATEAADKVAAACTNYTAAREEVARLNGQLERALRTEPSLRDPEAAERFRTEFISEHADVYEAERTAARELATALREGEPHLRADGITQGNVGNRMAMLAGLDTLASSSEYAQAIELAGQYGRGRDAPLPREETQGVAERAALTGLREDLSAGIDAEQAVRTVGGLLGAAGFARSTPALSAIGNAIGAGADLSAFMRTGDPASLGAAGFGALGTAAAVAAVFGAGPITIGAGLVALSGRFITRQIAGDNEYRAAIGEALAKTHGLTAEQTEEIMGQRASILANAGLSSADLAELARNDHLDEALDVLASGTPLDTGVYGDAIDPAERDARMRALELEEPGLPYISYEMRVVDAMREERRAQGTPAELLVADLRAEGLLP
ncbi:MAG: hypothetical protein ABTQ32_10705 [Myxococcaceae bacterium]